MRGQNFIPKSISKVVEVNLLPIPFNSLKVLQTDPVNARPTLIRFYRGDANVDGIPVMEMNVTYDGNGNFEYAYTKILIDG